MAEKKISIDIEVKNAAVLKAVANLQTEINKLRDEQKNLDRKINNFINGHNHKVEPIKL